MQPASRPTDENRLHIGLHTSSAVNVAEYAPHAGKGVDEYLKSYVDICPKLGAEWIVVHAGYHFTKDKDRRMTAGLERLKRIADYAHLVPEGVSGFTDALDFSLVGEVRLADCYRNGHEVHLKPGAGDLDFGDLFRRVEGKGFKGHYTNAFGSLEDRQTARDYLVEKAKAAGVKAG